MTIIIERGFFYLGHTTTNAAGEVVKKTPPKWEADKNGSCIVIALADEKTREPIESASLYPAYDALGIIREILKKQGIARSNISHIPFIFKQMRANGIDPCDYCDGLQECKICPIEEDNEK